MRCKPQEHIRPNIRSPKGATISPTFSPDVFGYVKTYKEFKLDAVRQVLEKGFSIAEIARRHDVSANLIGKWKSEYLADKSVAFSGEHNIMPEQEEIKRLRKALKVAEMERDILKKATAFFAKESS